MADAQQLVESLAAALDRSVLVEDPQHHPLWWSTQGEVDAVRMRSILQREAPPGAAALVSRLGLPAADGPIRTPALPDVGMDERWCVPLRDGRTLLGYLWVLDRDGQVGADELGPVVDCAKAVVELMSRARPTAEGRQRRRDQLVARLAEAPDPDALRELLELEDLPPGTTASVSVPPASGGWPLGGDASVHADPTPGATHTSGAPVPLLELAVAVERARRTAQAIRAGAVLPSPTWDALGAWHLIVTAPPELTPDLVHPGAELLAAQKRSDLLDTARCVLDNGGDVTSSAEQLHLHRTTLYYRLERIEALTGVNLRSAASREALHLALRLAAYRAAANAGPSTR